MSSTSKARVRMSRTAALVGAAAVAAAGLAGLAAPANAGITGGATNADGIPAFARDGNGIVLAPCDAGAASPCGAAFDPADATYFGADGDVGQIRFSYSVTGAPAAAGEAGGLTQIAKLTATGIAPGTYKIRDPWGTFQCAAPGGQMSCRVKTNRITAFLRSTTRTAGFLGGGADVTRPVTGSPRGFNQIVVDGPGTVHFSTKQFGLTGQLRPATPMGALNTATLNMGTPKRAASKTIRYSSFGTAPAKVTVAKRGAGAAAFRVTNGCANVASGRSCPITVKYTPKANRTAKALLTIRDNTRAGARTVKLTGTGVDTLAPKVVKHSPTRGARAVGLGKNVQVQFNETVRGVKGGLDLVNTSTGGHIAANISRVANTNRFVLNPHKSLAAHSTYAVKVNGGRLAVRDRAGNPARDTQWKFHTR